MLKECSFDTSHEEEKAFLIWNVINKYYSEIKGFTTLEFPKQILNDLHFEILSKSEMIGKRHLICISLKYHSIDLSKLHLHLMTLGINKEFICSIPKESNDDKSSLYDKSYLSIWI
jgi:hypothetical protein